MLDARYSCGICKGVLDGTCGVLESVNAVVDSAISYRACECVFPAK